MESALRKGAQTSRRSTLALLAVGCASPATGLATSLGDHPPGLVLVYLAVSAWIVAFARSRRRAKRFWILPAASLAGFLLALVAHPVFYGLAEVASGVAGPRQVPVFLEVGFFLIALLVCPPGVLTGAVGSVVVALALSERAHLRRSAPGCRE